MAQKSTFFSNMIMLYIVRKHFWCWFRILNLFCQIFIFGPRGGVKVGVSQASPKLKFSKHSHVIYCRKSFLMLISDFEFILPDFGYLGPGERVKVGGTAKGRPNWSSPNIVMLYIVGNHFCMLNFEISNLFCQILSTFLVPVKEESTTTLIIFSFTTLLQTAMCAAEVSRPVRWARLLLKNIKKFGR